MAYKDSKDPYSGMTHHFRTFAIRFHSKIRNISSISRDISNNTSKCHAKLGLQVLSIYLTGTKHRLSLTDSRNFGFNKSCDVSALSEIYRNNSGGLSTILIFHTKKLKLDFLVNDAESVAHN